MFARFLAAAALPAALLTATPALAQSRASFAYSPGPDSYATLTIDGTDVAATNRGWISQDGVNNFGDAWGNYLVGLCSTSDICNGDDLLRNNYFAFDLSSFNLSSISSVTLTLYQPDDAFGNAGWDGYISTQASETYGLYSLDYSNPLTDGGVLTFADLADGTYFGGVTVDASTIGTGVAIGLNGDAISAVFNAQGGNFVIGGTMIGVAAASAVPETGTWLMMILGIGTIGGMLRRRRGSSLAIALKGLP
jgi:hypothetical protein